MCDTPCLFLKNFLGRESADSVVYSNWYGSWEQLNFGGVQRAVPDARDLCWTNLSIWQGDHRNEFALPPPCFLYLCGFLFQRQEQRPALMLNGLFSSLFWLAS